MIVNKVHKTMFTTVDGREFETKEDAIMHSCIRAVSSLLYNHSNVEGHNLVIVKNIIDKRSELLAILDDYQVELEKTDAD